MDDRLNFFPHEHQRETLNDAVYRGMFDEPHEDAYL